jgi:hypothetical protein
MVPRRLHRRAAAAALTTTLTAAVIVGCTGDERKSSDRVDGRSIIVPKDCDELRSSLVETAVDRVTWRGLSDETVGDRQMPSTTQMPAPVDRPAEAAAPGTAAAEDSRPPEAPMTTMPVSAPPADTVAPETDGRSSSTNTQEAGVDEGDRVETDGRYLYVYDGRTLRVVDPRKGDVVGQVSYTDPSGQAQMILAGTRIALVSEDATVRGREVRVLLVDVSSPANPTRVNETTMDGTLGAVRAVDGQLRLTVTSRLGQRLPFVRPRVDNSENREQALDANKQIVRDAEAEDWLPSLSVRTLDGQTAQTVSLACTAVAFPSNESGLAMTWLASIDLTGDGAAPAAQGRVGVISSTGIVYATATSLYLAAPQIATLGDDDLVLVDAPEPGTVIHRFDLTETDATYRGSGVVPGVLLNQFAMSEYDGGLRVVTTTAVNNGPTDTGLHVLAVDESELRLVGSVSGMGRGETVRSVRFVDDRAYVVTFREVDPLYVIDLADPLRPAIAGELKIPGYSAYLHPIGDHRILGIGPDGDEFGRLRGTKLSLFDTSDPTNPVRVDEIGIGSQSAVNTDHHAFLWWADSETAFVPTSSWLTNPSGGVVVVDHRSGDLVERGRVSQDGTEGGGVIDTVDRTLIIDGLLVTVSPRGAQVSNLDTLEPLRFVDF